MAYVCYSDKNVTRRNAITINLITDTRVLSIFNNVKCFTNFFSNNVTCATDGAPSKVGCYWGFVAYLKEDESNFSLISLCVV